MANTLESADTRPEQTIALKLCVSYAAAVPVGQRREKRMCVASKYNSGMHSRQPTLTQTFNESLIFEYQTAESTYNKHKETNICGCECAAYSLLVHLAHSDTLVRWAPHALSCPPRHGSQQGQRQSSSAMRHPTAKRLSTAASSREGWPWPTRHQHSTPRGKREQNSHLHGSCLQQQQLMSRCAA